MENKTNKSVPADLNDSLEEHKLKRKILEVVFFFFEGSPVSGSNTVTMEVMP